VNIRPQDLPELRSELTAWNNEHGTAYFTGLVAAGHQAVHHDATTPEEAGRWIAATDTERLAEAGLFFVTREMTELVVTAAQTMPEWSLAPEDLPTPYGLIYLDGLSELRDFPTNAMSWGPCPQEVIDARGLRDAGLWLSHYVDMTDLPSLRDSFTRNGMPAPRLLYTGESMCAFGSHEPGNVSFYRDPETRDIVEATPQDLIKRVASLAVVKTAWLLMQQPLAADTEVQPDRAVRKRLRRAGHEPAPVRVIELRRPKTSNSPDSETHREYHHQWIVRGHWRQQWHPKRQVHRPVWIAPHIKGPEGAPLIGGEKVYTLKR
jgi:hypothetical protein